MNKYFIKITDGNLMVKDLSQKKQNKKHVMPNN